MLRSLSFGAAVLVSCGGGSDDSKPPLPVGDGQGTVQTFASGLNAAWGMAFLPDRRLLVTEKGGSLRLISADASSMSLVAVSLPGGLVTGGQGGLLDVAIDPDFASGQPWVYLSYSQPGPGGSGSGPRRGAPPPPPKMQELKNNAFAGLAGLKKNLKA